MYTSVVLLTAVLLNPSTGPGTVTGTAVKAAGEVVGAESVQIINLCAAPSRDLPTLATVGAGPAPWLDARPKLVAAITHEDLVLFAYGLGGLTGPARQHFEGQVRWVHEHAVRAGHDSALMLDGRPRHPSRWRQYLGPQRGLFSEATFEERLRAALRPVPLNADGPTIREDGRAAEDDDQRYSGFATKPLMRKPRTTSE